MTNGQLKGFALVKFFILELFKHCF